MSYENWFIITETYVMREILVTVCIKNMIEKRMQIIRRKRWNCEYNIEQKL